MAAPDMTWLTSGTFEPKLMVLTMIGTGISLFIALEWRDVFKILLTPPKHLKVSQKEKWSRFFQTLSVAVLGTVFSLLVGYGIFIWYKRGRQ